MIGQTNRQTNRDYNQKYIYRYLDEYKEDKLNSVQSSLQSHPSLVILYYIYYIKIECLKKRKIHASSEMIFLSIGMNFNFI